MDSQGSCFRVFFIVIAALFSFLLWTWYFPGYFISFTAHFTGSDFISNNTTEYPKHYSTAGKNSCVIIVNQQPGRLGNLMFKFASAYGLARYHDCKLYIDEAYLNALNATFTINIRHMSISKSEYLNLTGITVRTNYACHYFSDLMRPNSIRYLELKNYWQAYGHFIKHTDEIRQQFTFRVEIIRQITPFFRQLLELHRSYPLKCMVKNKINITISNLDINLMDQSDLQNRLKNSPFTLVGLHWRRGDKLMPKSINFGMTYSTLDYVNRAMNHFLDKYCDVLFIVASDDKKYCRMVLKNNSRVIITLNSFTREQDLAVLTVCQHTIVTVGTFGWFGAYLSGGDVVYDMLSPRKNSTFERICPSADFNPPGFLPLK